MTSRGKFWGATGGQAEFWGAVAPLAPPSSAPEHGDCTYNKSLE